MRERGNNDMAVDLGYSRRLGDRWAVGIVGRYMHLKRPDDTADALAVDLSAAWSMPLENVGSYSTLRVGGKLGNLGGYLGKTDSYAADGSHGRRGAGYVPLRCSRNNRRGGLGLLFLPGTGARFQMSVGAEYNLMQLIQLRAELPLWRTAELLPPYGSVGAGVRFPHPAPRFRLPDRTQGDTAAQHVQHQLRASISKGFPEHERPAGVFPGRCFAI
ncbi:MAG: hypothetical protein ACLUQ6_08745 [Alistipes onderdonkii]